MTRTGPSIEETVERLLGLGFELVSVADDDVAMLREEFGSVLGLKHEYFSFLEQFGALSGRHLSMLTPCQVFEERDRQLDFYEGGSFGDSPEEKENLRSEARFRTSLVPFQYRHGKGDLFCFVTLNRRAQGPLILDVYHDDFELAGPNCSGPLCDPQEVTVYTYDFAQHLEWVISLVTEETSYPPEG